MQGKIPATVITGFLGAGKTTMIRHILNNAKGRRIALVVNEFGDMGIDGEILKGCGTDNCDDDDVIELSNGCICCTVADDFVPAMQLLTRRHPLPDHIIIETSGLALPQPLVRAFGWPDIRNRLTVDSVITVVDSPATLEGRFASDTEAVARQRQSDEALDHDSPLAELFEDQLACADLVVANKVDLLDASSQEALPHAIEPRMRSGVRWIKASYGAVDTLALLGIGAGAEDDLQARAEIHHLHASPDNDLDHDTHDHDEFESFLVEFGELASVETFASSLPDLLDRFGILRLKGFAAVAGKPIRLVVQAVGNRVEHYFDRPFMQGEERRSHLVIIGETGLDRDNITACIRTAAR